MTKKRIPEVLIVVSAILLIALVITFFDKKIDKLNGPGFIPIKDSSNNRNNKNEKALIHYEIHN